MALDIPGRVWYYEVFVWDSSYEDGEYEAQLYPTKQQVVDTFAALAEMGALGKSFTRADIDKALKPYDSSNGLIIEYPLSRAFVDKWLGKFAPLIAATRDADSLQGPGSDILATMIFFKDGRKIRQLRPERDSGTRFIVLSLKLGNFVDLGFPDNTIHSDIAFMKFCNFDFEREIEIKLSLALKIKKFLVHISATPG